MEPERLLNRSMGAIGNQVGSIVSAVAEVYNLAKYMPKMRDAIESKWEWGNIMKNVVFISMLATVLFSVQASQKIPLQARIAR